MSTTSAAATGPAAHEHTRWPVAAVMGLAAAIVVGIVVIALAWPSATARARNLPIAISGPALQVSELRTTFEKMDPDPVELQAVDSRAEAVKRIRERRVYGAILLGDHPEVLTSSAASSASNQALRSVATQLQERISAATIAGLEQKLQQLAAAQASGGGQGAQTSGSGGGATAAPPTVKVTDVVKISSDDPTGAGIAASAFPIALGGMLGGILLSLLVVGVIRRLVALAVYGVGAGAIVTLVLQSSLHVLQGDWLANASALALAIFATASIVVGLNALIGRVGIAVGAVITVLLGNPISGAAVPYQFLPEPWGVLGQYFVPGSAATLLRSLSYFPDADTSPQWIALGCWAGAGVLLAIAGRFRSEAPIRLPARELEPHASATAAPSPSGPQHVLDPTPSWASGAPDEVSPSVRDGAAGLRRDRP